MDDFLPIPVVDAHLHMRRADGAPGLEALLRACGLRQVALMSIPSYAGEGPGQNIGGLLAKARHPDSVFLFGGLTYDYPATPPEALDFAGQARRLVAAGCDGIKMIEGKPGTRKAIGDIPLDSPLYDGFYGYLEANGIPLLSHVGDPETFWDRARIPDWAESAGWGWWRGEYPHIDQLRRETARVLAAFPRLKVIFAHFYFLSEDVERAAAFLDAYPNAALDITPGLEMYVDFSAAPRAWHDFFTTYQERILFGTDNTANETVMPLAQAVEKVYAQRTFLETENDIVWWNETLHGIALAPDALKKIYHRNFARHAGTTPKPVNLSLAIAECARVIAFAESREVYRAEVANYRAVMAALEALVG